MRQRTKLKDALDDYLTRLLETTVKSISDGADAGEAGERAYQKRRVWMNQEQFKGSWQQFKGEIKKKWGKFTDNDLLEAEGDYDKFLGIVQKRYGDKKEEVERWAEDWYERAEILSRKSRESRNQL
jgi:uncharacterized protein YjbJ (UPF0337 family)